MMLSNRTNNIYKIIFNILIILCLLIQAGCSNKDSSKKELETITTAAMYEAVKQNLKDPDSAKFKNVRYYSFSTEHEKQKLTINHALCGEINAKNAFGGYGGFGEFVTFVEHSKTSSILNEPVVVFDDPESYSKHRSFLKTKREHCIFEKLNSNVIYYLTGHGERDLAGYEINDIGEFGRQLEDIGFEFSKLDLATTNLVPSNATLLVIASTQRDVAKIEVQRIKAYLEAGGNLLWMLDSGNLHGLNEVAEYLGLQVSPGIVIDLAATQYGADVDVSFASLYGEHAITNNFKLRTMFPQAHEVLAGFSDQNVWKVSYLVEAAPIGWLNANELVKGEKLKFDDKLDKPGPINIGLALERKYNKKDQRIVVIGNAKFLSNSYITNGGNLDFGLNTIRWLNPNVLAY